MSAHLPLIVLSLFLLPLPSFLLHSQDPKRGTIYETHKKTATFRSVTKKKFLTNALHTRQVCDETEPHKTRVGALLYIS